jgi:hypothetical protein
VGSLDGGVEISGFSLAVEVSFVLAAEERALLLEKLRMLADMDAPPATRTTGG